MPRATKPTTAAAKPPSPPFEVIENPAPPDFEAQIELMASCGLTIEDISAITGVKVSDLHEKHSAIIARGAAKANFRVGAALLKAATDKDAKQHVTAAIYWTKARMGWAEAASGDDAAAPQAPSYDDLPDEEIRSRFNAIQNGYREAVYGKKGKT